jgi:hypothetical protein
MGDRAQVHIKDHGDATQGVWLYTHWDGFRLPNMVQEALKKRKRWDDAEYLARIIFCTMIKDDNRDETTGFGIGSGGQHDDVRRVIEVNCKTQTIVLRDRGKPPKQYTFEEFIVVTFDV